MNPALPVQVASIAFSAIGIVLWSHWARSHRRIWLYAVPPLSFLAHSILFYVAYLIYVLASGRPDILPAWAGVWGAGLRLHGILIVGLEALVWQWLIPQAQPALSGVEGME